MTYRTSTARSLLIIAGWAIPFLIVLFALFPPAGFALIAAVIWNERRHYKQTRDARAARIRVYGFDPYTDLV